MTNVWVKIIENLTYLKFKKVFMTLEIKKSKHHLDNFSIYVV